VAGSIQVVGFGQECTVGETSLGGMVECGDGFIPAGPVVLKAHPAGEHVASWTSTREPCVVTSVDAPNDTCTVQLDQPTQVHVYFETG
jgi:hypothetical protein